MKRNAKLSQSEPILGFTPAVDEKTEEKSQVKSAWGEKSNNVSSQRRSGRSAPRMPQMKLGNLLPRLDLEPVVNAIKVGDEEDNRKRKKKGKKVAMSPKKLKQSMKNLKPETLLKPSKSMTVIKSPTNSKFGPPVLTYYRN